MRLFLHPCGIHLQRLPPSDQRAEAGSASQMHQQLRRSRDPQMETNLPPHPPLRPLWVDQAASQEASATVDQVLALRV